jgi:hypothetical protein
MNQGASELTVDLVGGKLAFAPGEELRGSASWSLDGDPESVEVRLFWRTEGKGTQDVGIADSIAFEGPGRKDRREFRLKIPDGPYSFSGKLVAIVWSVEVVAEPGSQAGRQDIVVSPTGKPIEPPKLVEAPK